MCCKSLNDARKKKENEKKIEMRLYDFGQYSIHCKPYSIQVNHGFDSKETLEVARSMVTQAKHF